MSFVTCQLVSRNACNCSICFHINKQQQLKLLGSVSKRKYVLISAAFNSESTQLDPDATKMPKNKTQVEHNNSKEGKETQPQSHHSFGAEGVFQVILSILILYGSLLKKLFQTESRSLVQKRVWKSSSLMRELESSIPDFVHLPSEYRGILDNLCLSLQEIANEKSFKIYESASLRKVAQNVEEISRHLVSLYLEVERLRSYLNNIDKIVTSVSEPIKYLCEFEQRWDPSLSHSKNIVSDDQKKYEATLVVEDHSEGYQLTSGDLNGDKTIEKVENVANQVNRLSHFLRDTLSKDKPSVSSDVYDDSSTNVAKDSLSSDGVFSSLEFLKLLSFILPEATLAELGDAVSELSEKERWKQIRTFLTHLRQDLPVDRQSAERKDTNQSMQVIPKNYQNMSKIELVEELETRDSQIMSLKEQMSQAVKSKRKPVRKSSKSNNPAKSNRRLSGSDESAKEYSKE